MRNSGPRCWSSELSWRYGPRRAPFACLSRGATRLLSGWLAEQRGVGRRAAADKAVELDPENPYGHKWVAVSLGQASGLLGTKEKIQQSFRIKEEADKALEKLPDDAATHFLLGKWCLGVCSLGCAPPPATPAQQPSRLCLPRPWLSAIVFSL